MGGSESEEQTPTPVGFWDPSLKKVRNRAFAKWILTTAILMAFILSVLSIYWGVFFKVETRLKHLRIYVIDFDGQPPYDTGNSPFVGPAVTRLVQQQLSSSQPTLGWDIRSPTEFGNDPLQARQAVYNFDAWAAIIINPNATAMLYSAIQTGNASYDPMGACQLVYQDARDDTNWYDFIFPIVSTFMRETTSMVGKEWVSMALQNASNPQTLSNMRAAPQALSPAIGFSEFNLRPFFPYTGIPAVSIGLICAYLSVLHGYMVLLTYSLRSYYNIVLLFLLLSTYSYAVYVSSPVYKTARFMMLTVSFRWAVRQKVTHR
jgi:hypothetical protein